MATFKVSISKLLNAVGITGDVKGYNVTTINSTGYISKVNMVDGRIYDFDILGNITKMMLKTNNYTAI